MKKLKYKLVQLYFEVWLLWRTYVLRNEACENCKYFGGLCCDHVDEKGNCLGWERANLNPIHRWIYNYRLKKLVKNLEVKF